MPGNLLWIRHHVSEARAALATAEYHLAQATKGRLVAVEPAVVETRSSAIALGTRLSQILDKLDEQDGGQVF